MFLPIALAQTSDRTETLVAQAAKATGALCQGITDTAACHQLPSGCTANKTNDATQYDPYLAFLKNQKISPQDADGMIVHTWTKLSDFTKLDRAVQPLHVGETQAASAADLAKLGQGEIDAVVGYLYFAQQGGKEACNCKLTHQLDVDYHIGIGFDPKLAAQIANGTFVVEKGGGMTTDTSKQTSVVVESTPHPAPRSIRSGGATRWTRSTERS